MSQQTKPNLRKGPETNRTYGVELSAYLQSGVTISSVAKQQDPGGITVGTPAVVDATFTDPDGITSIAANLGYKVSISGGKAGTALAMHATDGAKVAPSGGTAAGDVGNFLWIISCAKEGDFKLGRYEITAQDGTNWTLDRNAGSPGVSTKAVYGLDYVLRVSYTDSNSEVDVATTIIEVRV